MTQDSSSPPPRPKGPSHKQHVRIWYEFYKLALNDPRLADQVEKSRIYYKPWGAVAGIPFDKWWPSHSHLFEDLRVREIQRVSPNDAVMYLALPLGLGVKRASNKRRNCSPPSRGSFQPNSGSRLANRPKSELPDFG